MRFAATLIDRTWLKYIHINDTQTMPIAANIIDTMKHGVNAIVLAVSIGQDL